MKMRDEFMNTQSSQNRKTATTEGSNPEVLTNGMETKIVTLATLQRVNSESIRLDYNRNLNWTVFKKGLRIGMNKRKDVQFNGSMTKVLLCPLMIHRHKNGIECEPHVRCEVYTMNILRGFITLDVPMETFDLLPGESTFLERMKEVA